MGFDPRLVVALVIVALGVRPIPGSDVSGDQAYVWQRDSSPAVAAAVTRGAGLLGGFQVLAAEISWANGEPETWRAQRDWAVLADLRTPTGLVLRIGPFAGPFASNDATATHLARLAAEILADARAGGVEPSGLQVDFDCAESKLDGYRAWLVALRVAAERAPLTITVLPSWMNARDAFARLVAATDGFVLQVHSLERPTGPDEPFVLCDPARARTWAAQAGAFGVPFRIALPTYGYLLNFDATGQFVSLSAEQLARPAPPGGRQRVVLADAIAVTDLARELRAQALLNCSGLIWFRLPVDGDQLNWTWPTFAKVVSGETLHSKIELAVQWPEPALAEIVVGNAGDTTEQIKFPIHVTWPARDSLVAADAVQGFSVEALRRRHDAILELPADEVNRLIAPGERRIVAWFRFPHATDLSVSFASSP